MVAATDDSTTDPLLDAKSMDGPVMKWAPNDLFACNKRLFMSYHVVESGWAALSPVGSLLGGALYGIRLAIPPIAPTTTTLLSSMGTFGFGTGCLGMVLGASRMYAISQQGEKNTPVPWNEDGIQQRVDGLSHNFMVRVLDVSAWSGMAVAGAALYAAGGPVNLGLAAGKMGYIQALTLGSSLGSLAAFGCIYSTLPKKDDDDNDDE